MASFIRNRCSSKAIVLKIPYEMWNDKALSKEVDEIKVFGCEAWAANMIHCKFDKRAKICVFVGFEPEVKGYRVWSLDRKKVVLSRGIIFNENVFPFKLTRDKSVPILEHVTLEIVDESLDNESEIEYDDGNIYCYVNATNDSFEPIVNIVDVSLKPYDENVDLESC
ncbi:hypothetical protein PR048_021734 [Dryococelus australis]|uniref:Retroviral polymerase SH3-like domain-containing protein n=1 Tax=Dryococelus australis TaxID=614101 RepID=A0ABQ9GZ40_9NEOP|nr:hypothetical protein PR048_021734 [Dryococelus australis]